MTRPKADRRLGGTDVAIPPLVLGGMFRDASARVQTIERALDFALDHGLHALDTAPLYGFGEGERVIGQWLRGRREQVSLLGKVGLRWDGGYGDVLFESKAGGTRRVVRRDSRPASVRRDVEESLGRLRCEALDLVQVHQRDPHTPLVETLGELVRLRDEGKLRAIGVSNFTVGDLIEVDRVLGGSALASTQNLYNLLERGVEAEILPWANASGSGFLAYSPLARGLLAGRVGTGSPPLRDGRQSDPLFQPRNAGRVNEAVEAVLRPIAREAGVAVGAVALAWLIARPGVTAALVGAQDLGQVEAAQAARALELTPEQHAAIDRRFRALVLDRSAGIPLARRAARQLRRVANGLRRVRARLLPRR